jgi:NADP-dependent 3-hydroxy acid dehydrogenase YdfG
MEIMSKNIEGKVVVITGASSGLGEAAARHLSVEGATVVPGARRVERIESLAGELTGGGGRALAVATDVMDCAQVKQLVDAAVETYGRIDVMINNAGLMPQSPLERLRAGHKVSPGVAVYAATKHAVRALSEGLRHLPGRGRPGAAGHRERAGRGRANPQVL